MTLTLATVFAPLAYMSGNTGRLFREFALAVSAAVFVSGFVALPDADDVLAACSWTGRCTAGSVCCRSVVRAIHAALRRMLAAALAVRPLVILFGVLAGAASGVLAPGSQSELAPIEDRVTIIGIISAPEGPPWPIPTATRDGSKPFSPRSRRSRAISWSWPRVSIGPTRSTLPWPLLTSSPGRNARSAAGNRGGTPAQAPFLARCLGLPDQSPVARPKLCQPPGAIRHPGQLLSGAADFGGCTRQQSAAVSWARES